MRLYSLGMIVLAAFVNLICFIMILNSTNDYLNPESDLKHNEYKEHISFEYYKQQELKRNLDSKVSADLTKLNAEEWLARWELSKKLSIQQVIHSSKSSLISTSITLICFLIIMGVHIGLYRKSNPMTITI